MRTDVDILSDYTDFSRCYRVHCPYKIIPIDSIHARISPVNGVIDRPDDVFETVGRRERERGSSRSFLPVPSPRSTWIALSIDFEIRNWGGTDRSERAEFHNHIFTANKQTILLIREAADVSIVRAPRLFINRLRHGLTRVIWSREGRGLASRGEKSVEKRE